MATIVALSKSTMLASSPSPVMGSKLCRSASDSDLSRSLSVPSSLHPTNNGTTTRSSRLSIHMSCEASSSYDVSVSSSSSSGHISISITQSSQPVIPVPPPIILNEKGRLKVTKHMNIINIPPLLIGDLVPVPPPMPPFHFLKKAARAAPKHDPRPKAPFTCPVCDDDVTPDTGYVFPTCCHQFCNECVSQNLRVQIFNGGFRDLHCLSPGCKQSFDVDMLQAMTDENTRNKYWLFHNSPDSNPNSRWCTKQGCGNAVVRPADSNDNKIICDRAGCGTAMCFLCRRDWHDGACDTKDETLLTLSKLTGTEMHSCPKCNILCEKDNGCEYVQCLNCKHGFCWFCLDPHDHNMSRHVHNPDTYKGPNAWNPGNVNRRRRVARNVFKGIGIGLAAVVLGPPALALGVAAVAVGGLPYLGYRFGKKMAQDHRVKKDYKQVMKRQQTWAKDEAARRRGLGLDVSEHVLAMAGEL
eukprot:TRINITY_DN220_c0_g1_i1.p1 TRINITY_DN220_c0_g1~~TRINITY_DN220_c0_g1_i1.p1  ORF type:complete len:469 (-),score=82.53 TRINITY_DN220_c0_g1_i1:206-1612(-)